MERTAPVHGQFQSRSRFCFGLEETYPLGARVRSDSGEQGLDWSELICSLAGADAFLPQWDYHD